MESSHKGVILNKNQQLINKKSELTSTCRHQNKLLLKCFVFFFSRRHDSMHKEFDVQIILYSCCKMYFLWILRSMFT